MSDTLKKIYEQENKAHRYFDGETPCELWRGQRPVDHREHAFLFQPHPGYTKTDSMTGRTSVRLPDVKIVERDGREVVLGCRCTRGDYRGLSTFDKPISWFKPAWVNFSIPKGTKLPDSLAVTKDEYNPKTQATHYTIAPKDDMPLALFIQSLKAVAGHAVLTD